MAQQRAKRMRTVAAALGALAVLSGLVARPADAATPPKVKVTAPEDVLGLSSRLVFSTVKAVATPARTFTITNTGGTSLKVTGLPLAGANPGQFKLRTGQATAFTVLPGKTATVGVLFRPTTTGVKTATLTVRSNDPARPSYVVALRGVNAIDNKGKNEASFANLLTTFGYTTKPGFTAVQQAKTRMPVGDEVVAPWFTRVDQTKPVRLLPIARYVLTAAPTPRSTWRTRRRSR
jgi:hypothetical protein